MTELESVLLLLLLLQPLLLLLLLLLLLPFLLFSFVNVTNNREKTSQCLKNRLRSLWGGYSFFVVEIDGSQEKPCEENNMKRTTIITIKIDEKFNFSASSQLVCKS